MTVRMIKMARVIHNRTYKGMKYKEIIEDDEPDTITQMITRVGKNQTHVRVISQNNKEYWVKCSDRVRMTMSPKPRDIAIIKTFPKQWLVVDIDPYKPEPDKYEMELRDLLEFKEHCEEYGWASEKDKKRILDRIHVLSDPELLAKEKEKELEQMMEDWEEIFGGY